MKILLPIYSTHPDAEHDVLMIHINQAFESKLTGLLRSVQHLLVRYPDFDSLTLAAPTLPTYWVEIDEVEPDRPDGAVRWSEYTTDFADFENLTTNLTVGPSVYLVTTKRGHHLTWDSRRTPNDVLETFETATFMMKDFS